MLENDYAPGFKAKLRQKDLRFAQETAQELKLSLPGRPFRFAIDYDAGGRRRRAESGGA